MGVNATGVSNVVDLDAPVASGGATIATQAEVNAGTNNTKAVSPLTLKNRALAYGKFNVGDSSGVVSDAEFLTAKKIYVNPDYGTDTRSTLSKYDVFKPFATITAAVAAWASGDVVWITAGAYAEKNIFPADGCIIWHELGANVTVSAALSTNDCIYGDNNSAKTLIQILGNGAFSIHDTNTAVDYAVLRIRANTGVVFNCLSAVAGTAGAKGDAFSIDASTNCYINVLTNITARNTCVVTGTGSPIVTINVGKGVSSPNAGFFCNAGTINIGQCPQNTANLCMYVTANGTTIYCNVGIIQPSANGIGAHGVIVGVIGSIVGASGVYAVDCPAAGTMNLVVGSISNITGADGRGITQRGAGVAYVTVLGANTATIPIHNSAGTLTVYNGEHFGNNATATVQIPNTGNAQRTNLVDCVLRNANAGGSNIDILDSTAITTLNGVVLISGATNTITGTATNTYTVMNAYANKIANAGLVANGNAAGFVVSTAYT